jgi:hypothetical protein
MPAASSSSRRVKREATDTSSSRFSVRDSESSPPRDFLRPVLAQAGARQHVVDLLRQGSSAVSAASTSISCAKPASALRARPARVDCSQTRRAAFHSDSRARARAPHLVQGALADAARRRVDRALEGRVVVAVGDQAQVGQRVLDFGALEEAHAAVHAVRHLLASSASSNARDCALLR